MTSNAKKEQLRQLMKQTQFEKEKTTPKKIDSPLARYNKLGQIVCIVCKALVKSEALWDAHCQSKSHKENILKLKEARAKKTAGPAAPEPSDQMDVDEGPNEEEPEEDMPQAKRPKLADESPTPASASRLPAGFFDKPVSAPAPEPEIEVDDEAIQAVMQTMSADDLAETRVVKTRASNFDVSEVEREIEQEFEDDEFDYDEEDEEDAASSLPSGFFDVGKRPVPKQKSQKRSRPTPSAPKPSVDDAFAEFSRSLAEETGEQIVSSTTPIPPPRRKAPPVKDADAELRELLAAMKDSDIDFDNLDVDEVTKFADDADDDVVEEEQYDEEISRQQSEQVQLLSRLEEAKKGNVIPASSTFAVVQEKLRQQQAQRAAADSDSSADEAELEDLYDWRSKGVSKKS